MKKLIPKVTNILAKNRNNVGDKYSSPLRYFKFHPDSKSIHIKSETVPEGNIVVGGGGIICAHALDKNSKIYFFSKTLEKICKTGRAVIWSIGHNHHFSQRVEYPSYLDECKIVGLRDYNSGYEYVPCASCLHSGFRVKREVHKSVAIYEHVYFPIPIDGFPKMNNNQHDINTVLDFLGSADTIITNSYHGMYWSMLLNKRVCVFEPFSTKFYLTKYPVIFCERKTWKTMVTKAHNYDEYLDECIDINLKFAEKVFNLMA